mmetsp:Transcript_22422/g.48268  ORF Transcript_22422/g.48268 Transcript_22422/m.48268 type:complete len:339 (-) Transcript_22422:1601-2617(-)
MDCEHRREERRPTGVHAWKFGMQSTKAGGSPPSFCEMTRLQIWHPGRRRGPLRSREACESCCPPLDSSGVPALLLDGSTSVSERHQPSIRTRRHQGAVSKRHSKVFPVKFHPSQHFWHVLQWRRLPREGIQRRPPSSCDGFDPVKPTPPWEARLIGVEIPREGLSTSVPPAALGIEEKSSSKIDCRSMCHHRSSGRRMQGTHPPKALPPSFPTDLWSPCELNVLRAPSNTSQRWTSAGSPKRGRQNRERTATRRVVRASCSPAFAVTPSRESDETETAGARTPAVPRQGMPRRTGENRWRRGESLPARWLWRCLASGRTMVWRDPIARKQTRTLTGAN